MSDPKRARCFDPDWRYTRSESTDIAALFRRVRKQLKDAKESNVKPLVKREKS